MSRLHNGKPPPPPLDEELVAAEKAMARQQAAMAAECERQDRLLTQDALRLLRQDRLALQDISETFLLRRLLVAAFGSTSTERQWALAQLLQLKGMKKGKAKPNAEDDADRLAILQSLKPG